MQYQKVLPESSHEMDHLHLVIFRRVLILFVVDDGSKVFYNDLIHHTLPSDGKARTYVTYQYDDCSDVVAAVVLRGS